MKNQYFADINDYKKYGLLRKLQQLTGHRIGFCWMLTANVERAEGEIRGYLSQPDKYRGIDPQLFDTLGKVRSFSQRNVKKTEEWKLFKGAKYFTELLSDRTDRPAYFANAQTALQGCPIMFFDPDNGMEVPSVGRRAKGAHKFIYFDELRPFYDRGTILVIYQHFPREERKGYIRKRSAQLEEHLPGCTVLAVSTAHVGYFIVVPPSQSVDAAALERLLDAGQDETKKLFSVTIS